MCDMSSEWFKQLSEGYESDLMYVDFALLNHIEPLGLTPEHIKGRVLVIGQAMAFPERTLLCTPESDFRRLRKGVLNIYCCDPDYFSSPKNHLDIPCDNTIFYDHVPDPQPNTAYFELSSSCNFLLRVAPDFFDTVLMFRAVDTGKQIAEYGLVQQVAPHLKKGGYFICSGGEFPENPVKSFYHPLALVRSVRLSDYSHGYPFEQNFGVILQK